MDIKDLDKKQLILLTLLITFIVSIATGIVTVSLMQQIPKSVPQTINNVIQRTIEKVTTVEVPVPESAVNENKKSEVLIGDGNALVSIYSMDNQKIINPSSNDVTIIDEVPSEDISSVDIDQETENKKEGPVLLGEGIIISDIGLILVESSILDGYLKYKVILDKKDYEVSVLKKYVNGITILKILSNNDIKNKEKDIPITTIP